MKLYRRPKQFMRHRGFLHIRRHVRHHEGDIISLYEYSRYHYIM